MNDNFDINNTTTFSVEFQYPVDEHTFVDTSISINEFITKFSVYILASKNPQLILSALLYSVGYDVGIIFGCENTLANLAKKIGVSKQVFSLEIKKVREDFGIKYANTGKTPSTKETYQKTNYRKI
jgi:uncharacterized protein YebE (UPF0316 family)